METIILSSDNGISNSSPFTFNGDASSSNYYKVITFDKVLKSGTILTFTATQGKRFVIFGVTREGKSDHPTIAAPTFSPAAGTYTSAQNVTINTIATEATIYYTTDGSSPISSSTRATYSQPIAISTTTTLKATVFKDGVYSTVAEAAFTIKKPYDIDFEDEVSAYDKWEFTNIKSKYKNSGVNTHGGEYYGGNINSNGNGTQTASIQTKETVNPKSLTCYVSKQSNNTTSSTWYIQVSSNGTDWTTKEFTSATDMSKGEWKKFTADLSSHSNVYVRVYYNGTDAIRLIDDLSLEVSNVSTPTFSVEEGTYSEAKTVAIECNTEGASIYYTTDGSNPTNSNGTLYTNPITISETTTLKAIAYAESDHSAVASAIYTILQLKTIAEARAQETGVVVVTKGIVTSCVGTTAYIQDNDAAICVYGQALTVGTEYKVQGTLSTFKGLLEITEPICTVVSTGNVVTPEEMTIGQIIENGNVKQGWLIKVVDAEITQINGDDTKIAHGDKDIDVHGDLGEGVEVGKLITLTGNIGYYDTSVQIANPTDVSVRENPIPNLAIEPYTTTVPADGITDATLDIVTKNIDLNNVWNASISYFDSNEESISNAPEWINISVSNDKTKVNYSVQPNESSEARTVYFKIVFSSDDLPEGNIWSDMVTITQEGLPSIVKYALVTSTDNLAAGDKIIIVNADKNYALSTTQNSNNRGATEVSLESDGTIIPSEEVQVITLEQKENKWYFNTGSGYLYASSSSSNQLKTEAKPDEKGNASAAIVINNGVATITFQGDKTRNLMRYNPNNNNPMFACYASNSTTGTAVRIYKEVKEQPQPIEDTPFTLTISSSASDGEYYYATMSAIGNGNFVVPQGIEASSIIIVNKKIQKIMIYEAGDVLDGKEAYLIEASAAGSYVFETTTDAAKEIGDNWLYPAKAGEPISIPVESPFYDTECKYYQLSLNSSHAEGSVGFYYGPESTNGEAFAFKSDHKAFLAVPVEEGTGASIGLFDGFDGIADAIVNEGAQRSVYTLTGVRVDSKQLPKGIYIIDGKKQVVK